MRLTVYTDYALRVLMYLGLKQDRLATIKEIAEGYGISNNHLMKVVHDLGLAGYVETVRGKHGGIRLARPTTEIRLGELVRHTEPDMALVQCFDPAADRCPVVVPCVLRSALGEALHAFLDTLDGYTLEDLLKPKRQLSRLLAIDSAGPADPPEQGEPAGPAAPIDAQGQGVGAAAPEQFPLRSTTAAHDCG